MNKNFSSAIYVIIKPLIGLMLRNGIAFGDFLRLAKRAYVEEAEKELKQLGQKTTTSRIAVITGLTRKDVAALRKENSPQIEYATHHNRAVRVISAWISDPDFYEQKGKAKVLDIHGAENSFEALVSRYSGDMPYRAVLDELVRTGAVERKEKDQVELIRDAYVPSGEEEQKYAVLGEDVNLLISTIKHNIIKTDDEARYQRKVCYNRIAAENLPAFKELANKENQNLLLKLNTWLAEHDMDRNPAITSETPMKVGVGVYYFEELADKREEATNEN